MAPRKEAAHPFKFGEVGRQTGITLPDKGERDEFGFEPTEGLFSTGKSTVAGSMRKTNGLNATLDSDDMDEGESSIPEPRDVLENRRSGIVLPPPKGKSPAKTSLNSPARRNPSMGRESSVVRGTIVEPKSVPPAKSVKRILDFSTGSASASKNAGTGKLGKAPTITPMKRPHVQVEEAEEDEEDDLPEQVQGEDSAVQEAMEDSYQVNGYDDDDLPVEEEVEAAEEVVEEPEVNTLPAKESKKGKRPAKSAEAIAATETVPPKKGRGRPKRDAKAVEETANGLLPPSKKRKSDVSVTSEKPTTKEVAKASAKNKKKASVKKVTLPTTEESDSPQVPRGPPLPRRGALAILRRQTPAESTAYGRTRYGRTSIRPVEGWRNEVIEYEDEEMGDGKDNFLVRKIKEVVRIDAPAPRKPQKWKSKSKPSKKRSPEPEEEPAEPWESEPGKIYGDVVVWDPEDPAGAHGEEREDEIALSAAAINTRPVADASFQFAKTLTLPFFGSGVVDLPPGSIKRQKNARKMQMAFFVFTGRVKAIVNGNEFRIGKGGMFQVPRGNTYSIENDYEDDARIFFSQGCEVIQEDPDQSQG